MFDQRSWSLELEDGVPANVPVASGHEFIIAGIHAVSTTPKKIVLEAIVMTIRPDKVGDDDDLAPTDTVDTLLAVVFPQSEPALSVKIAFSELNSASLRATGGSLVVTGFWRVQTGLRSLEDLD
jgi:hypothetical protein